MMYGIVRSIARVAILAVCFVDGASAQDGTGDELGPIHVGRYDAIDTRARIKLWLARYTSPALLATSDVAFAYALPVYCEANRKSNPSAFYTDTFAVGRAVGTGYAVSKLEQLHKIDACKSPKSGMAVLTKRPLGDVASVMVINWNAEQSVGGLSVTEPMRSPGTSYQFNSSGIPTAFIRELDTKLLLAYASDLARRGVEISLGTSAWYPSAAAVPAMAPLTVISRSATAEWPAASPSPVTQEQQATSAKKKYCLRSLPKAGDKTGDCFDGVGDLALRLQLLPESDTPKGAAVRRQALMPAAITKPDAIAKGEAPPSAPPYRYVLEVN